VSSAGWGRRRPSPIRIVGGNVNRYFYACDRCYRYTDLEALEGVELEEPSAEAPCVELWCPSCRSAG